MSGYRSDYRDSRGQDDRPNRDSRYRDTGNYEQNRGRNQYGNQHRGGSIADDDSYSQSSSGSRGSYGNRGGGYGGRGGGGNNYSRNYQGGGGYRGNSGNQGDGLSKKMSNLNMYSQHSGSGSSGNGSRGSQGSAMNLGDFAGGAYNKNAPIAKKDLPYNQQEFAARPEKMVQDMKLGQKTELFTNHTIVALPAESIPIYCYDVQMLEKTRNGIEPITKREIAGKLFREIATKNRSSFPNLQDYIFNDVNMLWTQEKLPNAEIELDYTVGRNKYFLILKFTGTIDFGAKYDEEAAPLFSTIIDAIATSRIRTSTKKYTVFKRLTYLTAPNAHEPSLPDILLCTPLKNGFDARVGFSIGIRMNLRAGPTACFDLNHTMFIRSGYPVIRLLVELSLDKVISDEEYEEIFDETLRNINLAAGAYHQMSRIMEKMKILYSLENARDSMGQLVDKNNRLAKRFKFSSITNLPADQDMFTLDDGREISVAKYYQEVRGVVLRYPNLPCLLFNKKNLRARKTIPIKYPLEFCSYIADIEKYEGFANQKMDPEMVKHCTYTPEQRRMLLNHIIKQKKIGDTQPIVKNDDLYMSRHGVTFGQDMLSVKATILPPPTLVYGNGTFKDTENCGTWEAIRNEPIRTVLEDSVIERKGLGTRKKVLLGSIVVIQVEDGRRQDYNAACYHRLMKAISLAGQPVVWENEELGQAAIQADHYWDMRQDPAQLSDYLMHLRDNIDEKYKKEGEVVIPIAFMLFTARCSTCRRSSYNAYNLMKQLGDHAIGVYTQGMLLHNFTSISADTQNCMLTCHLVEKILGKVGTTHRIISTAAADHKPWSILVNPNDPTLVLGIDVSHPSPAQRQEKNINSLSVATVVGNIDIAVSEFRSSSRIQDVGEELIVRMEDQVQERIRDFSLLNGTYPGHIVVYRDGIAEGDFQRTLYEERTAIENSCAKIDATWKPTLTYIVATKRHHTQFFPKNENDVGADGNMKPGTLVEDVVTTKKYFDFFLSTQVGAIRSGTVRPTHYYVLHDTWQKTNSFWPCITHVLTYNFCRTTSTIAIPAPLIYAHLAAKRAKDLLDGQHTIDVCSEKTFPMGSAKTEQHYIESISIHRDLDGMTFV